jgi:hypothetical protein
VKHSNQAMPPQTPYSSSCLLLQLLTHRPTLQQPSFLAKGITSKYLLHTCLAVRSVASTLLQSSLQDKHTNFRVPAQDAWLLLTYYLNATSAPRHRAAMMVQAIKPNTSLPSTQFVCQAIRCACECFLVLFLDQTSIYIWSVWG